MNAFFNTHDDVVTICMTAESEDGGTLGDLVQEVRTGEDFAGISYDDLVATEAGQIKFDEDGKGSIVEETAKDHSPEAAAAENYGGAPGEK